jgi:DNA-binding NarL/FixJ family response regulator
MSISVSNSLSTESLAAANSSSDASPAPKTQAATNATTDTIKLSESQQIHQLYNEGQKVSQIAFNLNITVEAVNSYLGIRNATG